MESVVAGLPAQGRLVAGACPGRRQAAPHLGGKRRIRALGPRGRQGHDPLAQDAQQDNRGAGREPHSRQW